MKIPRVALLIETSNAYARGLLAGIADFVRDHGPWSIDLPEMGRADARARHLRGWKGDGIIARVEDQQTATALKACKCPIVDVSTTGNLPRSPSVHSDNLAEAAAAFEHLWDRGFRNLGFCGISNYKWVDWQRNHFQKLAAAVGIAVAVHVVPLRKTGQNWSQERRWLARWLKELPKPVGIFACYDPVGQQVLEACRTSGLRVPDEVAVIGVDNDIVHCSLSDPPLSSVVPDTHRVGYLAAELLTQMMAGKRTKPGIRFVAPRGVIARRSTDAIAIDDPDISAALAYIRANACGPITIETILEQVPVSRRTLESRFVAIVGRTPHAEILRCRLERARQLLRDTDLPIKSIAGKVGVGTPEYLSVLFKRVLKTSPTKYREEHK